ncbi:MAG: glycoside hydrolase family 3 N-terminal domain-containing protein [Gaiellaceae bacterium]
MLLLSVGSSVLGGDGSGAEASPARGSQQTNDGRHQDGDKLPLSSQVGRLVVLRFAGTSAPAYVRDILREGRAAGAILFRDNVIGPAQTEALTSQLRRGAQSTPLICVDQEGGEIRILRWLEPARSAPQQGAAGTERVDARAAARGLRAVGINVSLAPVADVPSVPGAALSRRAFSTDFDTTADSVAEAVRGWRDGGVAATVKHFPGLGGARANTDDASVTISRGAARLRRLDLKPFRRAIQAGVPLVMVGHAVYPAVDRARIASQSKAVIGGLLRSELGFRGVVITDSTEAAAVQAVSPPPQAAVRNVRAGVDIVLTTGRGSYIRVYRRLLAEARRDPAFRASVRGSAARVLALQRALEQ